MALTLVPLLLLDASVRIAIANLPLDFIRLSFRNAKKENTIIIMAIVVNNILLALFDKFIFN